MADLPDKHFVFRVGLGGMEKSDTYTPPICGADIGEIEDLTPGKTTDERFVTCQRCQAVITKTLFGALGPVEKRTLFPAPPTSVDLRAAILDAIAAHTPKGFADDDELSEPKSKPSVPVMSSRERRIMAEAIYASIAPLVGAQLARCAEGLRARAVEAEQDRDDARSQLEKVRVDRDQAIENAEEQDAELAKLRAEIEKWRPIIGELDWRATAIRLCDEADATKAILAKLQAVAEAARTYTSLSTEYVEVCGSFTEHRALVDAIAALDAPKPAAAPAAKVCGEDCEEGYGRCAKHGGPKVSMPNGVSMPDPRYPCGAPANAAPAPSELRPCPVTDAELASMGWRKGNAALRDQLLAWLHDELVAAKAHLAAVDSKIGNEVAMYLSEHEDRLRKLEAKS